jgi:hypothetical protein
MAVEEKRTMATTKRKRVSQGGSRDCHEEEHVLQPPEVGWSHHQHQVPLFLLSPHMDPLYPGTLHGVSPSLMRPSMVINRRSLSPLISHCLVLAFRRQIL